MIRVSNRQHDEHSIAGPQVQFVDRLVEVPVEVASAPEIVYVDREVIKEVHMEAPSEQIILKQEVDLAPIHGDIEEIRAVVNHNTAHYDQFLDILRTNVDMQSRALVALKVQRDIDRSRRLMLMKRIKKEHNAHKKTALKLKLAIGASLLISIVSLIVKL